MSIRSVTIVGQGNVAYHFCDIMNKKGMITKTVSSRLPFLSDDLQSDLIVIAVKDDAIEIVANELYEYFHSSEYSSKESQNAKPIVAHTSGYMSTECLKRISPNYGSFYPLQTLKKGIEVNFAQVPICTWGSNETTAQNLESLATKLSNIHYKLDDEQRKSLHVAAVFANNFPNHLFGIAKRLLDKSNIPFDILFPLIDRTTAAVKENNPFDIQTGPAIRNDEKVMSQHKKYLSDIERKIYEALSESIIAEKNNRQK